MKLTKLGRTNLQIPELCWGLAPISDMPGTYGHGVTPDEARIVLNAIFDSAYPFVDTSRNYGLGRSEERLGDALRARGGKPKNLIISSKLDRDMDTLAFDAAQARRSLEESLKAMGVDRIDLLHLHDPEHARDLKEIGGRNGALAELFKMKEEGLCTAVGLAAGRIDIMMPMLRDWDFDALITHNRFTLVNRNAEPMIELARARGITVINGAPYAAGVLAKGSQAHKRYVYQEATAEMLAPVQRIEAVCAKHGIPVGAAALQFSLRDNRIASTIIGISKAERIAQTIAWADYKIPQAAWDELMTLPAEHGDPEATRTYSPD
ncbi:MAG: aldo/keto reductase [Aestuariivirga sp.]